MNYKNLNHLLIFFMLFTGTQITLANQPQPTPTSINWNQVGPAAAAGTLLGVAVMAWRNAPNSALNEARKTAEEYKAILSCETLDAAWRLPGSHNQEDLRKLTNLSALFNSLQKDLRLQKNPRKLLEAQEGEKSATRASLFVEEMLARQELNDATVRLANMFIASQDGNTVKSLQTIKQIAINFFGSSSPNPLAQTLTEAENARATCIKLKNSPIAKQSPSFRSVVTDAERALQALMHSIQTSHQYNQELAAQEKIREIEERNSKTAAEKARQDAVAQRLDQERLAQRRAAQDLEIAKHAKNFNLVQSNNFLQEQNTNLTHDLTKAKEKCQELAGQVGTLENKLRTANHTILGNNLKIGQLEAKIKGYEDALKKERRSHQESSAGNATERNNLNEQIKKLKEELSEAQKEKTVLKKNYDLLNEQYEQLKSDLTAKDLKATQLEAALAAARATNPAAHEPAG